MRWKALPSTLVARSARFARALACVVFIQRHLEGKSMYVTPGSFKIWILSFLPSECQMCLFSILMGCGINSRIL